MITVASLLALAAVSCSKVEDGTGRLVFDIASEESLSAEVKGTSSSKVSDFTSIPGKNSFTLTLKNSSNAVVWKGLLSEWSSTTPLPVGNYTAEAVYGSISEEGADKPCFMGSTAFAVEGGKTVNVGITTTLQNCIARLECTDSFKNYFKEYSFTVKSGAGKEFVFGKDMQKAIFIDAYKLTVSGTLTNQAGTTSKMVAKTFDNLEPATCYTLKMDASNVGGIQVTIIFNNDVQDIDLGQIEINE